MIIVYKSSDMTNWRSNKSQSSRRLLRQTKVHCGQHEPSVINIRHGRENSFLGRTWAVPTLFPMDGMRRLFWGSHITYTRVVSEWIFDNRSWYNNITQTHIFVYIYILGMYVCTGAYREIIVKTRVAHVYNSFKMVCWNRSDDNRQRTIYINVLYDKICIMLCSKNIQYNVRAKT